MKRSRKVGGSRGPGRGKARLLTQNVKMQLDEQQRPALKPIAYVSGYGFVYERAA